MEKGIKLFRNRWKLSVLLLSMLLVGCAGAGPASFSDGLKFYESGDYDQAVAAYGQAVASSPGNPEYKMRLDFARAKAAAQHKALADEYLASGQYAKALGEYRIASRFNPGIETLHDGVQSAQNHLEAERLVNEGRGFLQKRRNKQAKKVAELALQIVPDFAPAQTLLDEINADFPTIIDGVVLEVASLEPITLNFTKVRLPDAFKILTDLSGINFILDEDIRSKTTTLYLENATFAQALELMLSMNKLDKKVLNKKTLILFPKNKDKQKQFEDQVIQTFYLSNIDAKKAVNLLRTILQLRKVYVHEELNAVVIRDNPAVIKLAEKILEANDRASSEVVFDLELIEISHSDDLDIGPNLDPYGFSVGLRAPGTETATIGPIVVDSLKNLDVLYSLPSATFNLKKSNGEGEVLANPKIRVKNKEKAKVHIGSREPVVTVTINGEQTSENVQYIDVGVKLDVEPTIQLDDTIVTKLGLEVSNVAGRASTTNGTAILTISTTNANTTLTLKDGQQTVLGGLIRTSETISTTTIPILGDIPLLGKLFTSYVKGEQKREILLSITPHLVRSLSLPRRDVSSLWSGGEDDFKNGPNFGSFAEDFHAAPAERAPNAVPANIPPRIIDTSVSDDDFENHDQPEDVGAAVDRSQTESGQEPATNAVPEEIVAAPPVAAMEAPSQLFLLGSQLAKKGTALEIIVIAEEVRDLFSAPMYISYDARLLDFVRVSEGAFMKKAGETVFTSSNMPEKGQVIVGLKQTDTGQGVSGGGALFKLVFWAKETGIAEIKPENVNFRNPQGLQLPVAASGITVEIEQ
jgi:general secretion pathway protein D